MRHKPLPKLLEQTPSPSPSPSPDPSPNPSPSPDTSPNPNPSPSPNEGTPPSHTNQVIVKTPDGKCRCYTEQGAPSNGVVIAVFSTKDACHKAVDENCSTGMMPGGPGPAMPGGPGPEGMMGMMTPENPSPPRSIFVLTPSGCQCVNVKDVKPTYILLNKFQNTKAGQKQCEEDMQKNFANFCKPAKTGGEVPLPGGEPPLTRTGKKRGMMKGGMKGMMKGGMKGGMKGMMAPPGMMMPGMMMPGMMMPGMMMPGMMMPGMMMPGMMMPGMMMPGMMPPIPPPPPEPPSPPGMTPPTKLPPPKPPKTTIDRGTFTIINKSTKVKDSEVVKAIKAIQNQVDKDFMPWGIKAKLVLAKTKPSDSGALVQTIMDKSDVADAAGYHAGPVGVTAVEDSGEGLSWVATLSHEVLETLADPDSITAAPVSTWKGIRGRGKQEVCDPVQRDKYPASNGFGKMSNFVYPTWYDDKASGPFDFMQTTNKPQKTTGDGYVKVGLLDPAGKIKDWVIWDGEELRDRSGKKIDAGKKLRHKNKLKGNVKDPVLDIAPTRRFKKCKMKNILKRFLVDHKGKPITDPNQLRKELNKIMEDLIIIKHQS